MPFCRTLGRAAALVFLALLPALPAAATSFVRVSDENLVDGASAIAVGRVLSLDRSVGAAGTVAPSTDYVVALEAVLKGGPSGATVTVRVPGGQAPEGMSLRISGAPSFRSGERVILFLEPGRGGTYRLKHFVQGAFHEAGPRGGSLAVRDLSGALEVKLTTAGPESVEGSAAEEPRDFDAFVRWIRKRAAGERPPADYLVDPAAPGVRSILQKYTLFSGNDGNPVRWFTFDSGGTVSWRTHQSGQSGLAGGGVSEAVSGMAPWNADAATSIRYVYDGTTSAASGFRSYDGVNTILWNDPNGEVDGFSCGVGGTLAIGGPWFGNGTTSFLGRPYHGISGADIVVNNGLDCYFSGPGGVTNATAMLAHELGHTLGLDHSANSSALMYYAIQNGRGPGLGGDDVAAIACVYAGACGGVPPPAPTAPAAPGGLGATVLSSSQVRLNWSDNASNETSYRVEMKSGGGAFSPIVTLAANANSTVVSGLAASTSYTFRVRAAGSGGLYSGYSNEAGARTLDVPGGGGTCTPSTTSLCLDGGRFRVSVTWRQQGGATGVGTVVPALTTADSGVFWFFNAANWELMVKVLDGCGVNQRHWVFFGGATNQGFTLTVTDTRTGQTKTYSNPVRTVSPIVTDTSAFAACP